METARWRLQRREQGGKEEIREDKMKECRDGGREGEGVEEKIIGSKSTQRDKINKATPFYVTTGMRSFVHELWIFRMKQNCQKSQIKTSVDCYLARV